MGTAEPPAGRDLRVSTLLHDLNDALMVVYGGAYLLAQDAADGPTRDAAASVNSAALRAGQIARQLGAELLDAPKRPLHRRS